MQWVAGACALLEGCRSQHPSEYPKPRKRDRQLTPSLARARCGRQHHQIPKPLQPRITPPTLSLLSRALQAGRSAWSVLLHGKSGDEPAIGRKQLVVVERAVAIPRRDHAVGSPVLTCEPARKIEHADLRTALIGDALPAAAIDRAGVDADARQIVGGVEEPAKFLLLSGTTRSHGWLPG